MRLYDFDDILIKPVVFSNIRSREDIEIKDENGFLPLFTAPMDTVVCELNYHIFKENNIYYIRPRTGNCPEKNITSDWVAYSLEDFEKNFCEDDKDLTIVHRVLIDIANGHMVRLLNAVKKAKSLYGDKLIIMVGNIANPLTAFEYAKLNIDYIRLGIGAGASCLTTVQTGVGYPMASLIKETRDLINTINSTSKLVADGGFKKYSDIIKAYALGADYVMLGSIFNKALESAGDTYIIKNNKNFEFSEKVNQYDPIIKEMFKKGQKFYKKFRGMSTKEVQRDLKLSKIRTSEGIIKFQPVEYTISDWVENFSHYLRSAMSYCDSISLDAFKRNSQIIHITNKSFERFVK